MPQIDIRLVSSADVAGFNNTSRAAVSVQQSLHNASTAAAGVEGAIQRVGRSNSQVMLQAGNQVQDFVVQVAGGQKVLLALAQQGSQFLGAFGPTGAIAGAVLAVGALAGQFLMMSKNIKESDDRAKSLDQTLKSIRQQSTAAFRQNLSPTQELDWVNKRLAQVREQKAAFDAAFTRAQQGMGDLANQAGGVDKITNINVRAPEQFRQFYGVPDSAPGGKDVYDALLLKAQQEQQKSADLQQEIVALTADAQALQRKLDEEKKKGEAKGQTGAEDARLKAIKEEQTAREAIAAAMERQDQELAALAQRYKEFGDAQEKSKRQIAEIDMLERGGQLTAAQATAARARITAEMNDTAGKAIRAAREELEKYDRALAKIDANAALTTNEKHAERLKVLNEQEAAIARLKKALEDFAAANPGIATAAIGSEIQTLGNKAAANERDRVGPSSAIENARTGYRESQQGGFQSVGEGAEGGLLNYMSRLGTMADQVAAGIENTLGAAVDGITQGILGWINGTMTLGKALANIGNSVLQSILQTLVQMGVRMLINAALGNVLQKAAAVAAVATAAATAVPLSAIWAGPATLAAIATMGGAAAQAPGSILAAKGVLLASSIAGFANGVANLKGPGTGTSDSILARLSAGESVLTARTTDFLGEDFINMLNADPVRALARPAYQPPGAAAGAGMSAGAGGSAEMMRPQMIVVFDPREAARMMQENSSAWFYDMMREANRKNA